MEKGASQVSNFHFTCFQTKQGGVCHIVALPFTLKSYLMAKKEMALQILNYFTIQKYNLQKNPLKETQSPSRCYITLL
jgi:hypothetical protein